MWTVVTQVHEDALAEFKAKVEQDMKEFEEKRKEEIEKIQSVGAEEKKQLEVRRVLIVSKFVLIWSS